MSLEDIITNLVNWLVIPFVGFVMWLHLKLNRLEVNVERLLVQIDERQKHYLDERREMQRERDQARSDHLEVNRELRDAIIKLNERLDGIVRGKP